MIEEEQNIYKLYFILYIHITTMAQTVSRRTEKSNRIPVQPIRTNNALYMSSMLEMNVLLSPTEIGIYRGINKTKENLQTTIAYFVEGKCISEGYVQPKSVSIVNYSSGMVKGDKIEFCVVFQCKTCLPVEGMWIYQCKVKSVTKAGIHANVFDEQNNIPATVFVVRDHFMELPYFNTIKENDTIDIRVIGTRFELNDSCIEVLGNLIQNKS